MSNETFVEHLAFLNQLSEETVTSMCHMLMENQAWPEVEGVLLDPSSLIVFVMSALAGRLAPDIPVEEHIEMGVLGQCLGMLLTQQDVAAIAANVEAVDLGLVITEEKDGKVEAA